jgi:hypothetical protein
MLKVLSLLLIQANVDVVVSVVGLFHRHLFLSIYDRSQWNAVIGKMYVFIGIQRQRGLEYRFHITFAHWFHMHELQHVSFVSLIRLFLRPTLPHRIMSETQHQKRNCCFATLLNSKVWALLPNRVIF